MRRKNASQPGTSEERTGSQRSYSVKSARWSAADVLLIDEAAGLMDRVPSYGHIVVDEAQDLSPMQCRAIARRSEHGSLTVLGDLAQGTAPWASDDWRTSLAHLGRPDAPVVPLTVGFRVPSAVVDLANRLLPSLGVSVPEAVSLRRDGLLSITQVTDLAASTAAAVAEALTFEGSVAVICPDAAAPVYAPLADDRVTIVPATLAKGLEFDHVIVVEPAEIVAAEPKGLARLYVVLTRAVSRLTVLHTGTWPLA